jgi:hypothetical protein
MTETAGTAASVSAAEHEVGARSSIVSWYRESSDPGRHPRLAFLLEYTEGLGVTVIVYTLTRLAYALLLVVNRALPAAGPDDTHWYLPINFLRSLVTVIDIVALLFISISSMVGLFRLTLELIKTHIHR